MQQRGRSLVICMPHDPRALVDLLLYLEKNFTTLPLEVDSRSLAFDLLKTVNKHRSGTPTQMSATL